jgi:hemerythrin-like domain-containing protein
MEPVQPDRVVALSQQLIEVHQGLRERLADLRQQAAVGEPGPDASAGAGGLLDHCLSFCRAVQTHHTGEDSGLFPALQAAAPELAPVIVKLTEDHTLVAGILRQVRDLLASPGPRADPGTLRRELDGLTAILESHFGFEERRLASALDALGPEARFPAVFTPEPPG